MTIKHTLLPTDNATLIELEKLRAEAFDTEPNFRYNWYTNSIESGRLLPFGTYVDNELGAGAYIEQSNDTLYITLIFTKPKYQNTGLKLSRELLKYIISKKDIIDEYYGSNIAQVELSYMGKKTHDIYIKAGFQEEPSDIEKQTHRMYKII